MKFFDSHAHYFDVWFDEYEGGADALLKKLFSENVGAIVNVATNPENLAECIDQAKKYENMYVSAGIHPEDCLYIEDIDTSLAKIESAVTDEQSLKENKIVAIGEIGFDYHVEGLCDEIKAKQRHCFEYQMELAKRTGFPVVIHDREAHGDCFDIAMEFPEVRGVFHSYSGSAEMAKELLKHGWLISFSGVVTFKNARKVKEVAEIVPLDRMLIETDCPYLAPHPMRGKLNHSGYLKYTAQALAEIKGASLETVIEQTAKNAKSFFGIQ